MKLKCSKCKIEVECDDDDLRPIPKGAVSAEETCPDCSDLGDFSDLRFVFRGEVRTIDKIETIS